MVVTEVKDKNELEKFIREAGKKMVIVDFFATWCGPCKFMGPKFEKFSIEFPDHFIFLKIDVDEQEELANEYDISVMPTFVFIRDSQKIDVVEGNEPNLLKITIEKYSREIARIL